MKSRTREIVAAGAIVGIVITEIVAAWFALR